MTRSIEQLPTTVDLWTGRTPSCTTNSKNAENVLVLHDPVVAQRYGQEWERLAESEDLKPRY
jgi:hypothetical protein